MRGVNVSTEADGLDVGEKQVVGVQLWGSSNDSDLSILVVICPLNNKLSHKRERVNLY